MSAPSDDPERLLSAALIGIADVPDLKPARQLGALISDIRVVAIIARKLTLDQAYFDGCYVSLFRSFKLCRKTG